MYNTPNEPLPLFLPVAAQAQLRPWFDTATLDHGLEEIRRRSLSPVAAVRSTVGALIGEKAVVILSFDKSATLHQGFFIASGHCDLCTGKAGGKACHHQAALAILSLVEDDKAGRPLPLPLAFAGGNWQKLGGFLHDWLAKAPLKAEGRVDGDLARWRVAPPEGALDLALPSCHHAMLQCFLMPSAKEKGKGKAVYGPGLLLHQLRQRTMKESERVMERRGASSIGLQRDTSFASWLAQTLVLLGGDTLPRATMDLRHGLRLSTGERHLPASLTLRAPRRLVWELARLCPWEDREMAILPAAKECFHVFIREDQRIEVHPALRRESGMVLSRVEMAERCFSSAVYLDGEGFLPLRRISPEAMIQPPGGSSSAPAATGLTLLSFLHREENKDKAFVVEINQLPAFLAANDAALRHADNLVDPALLDLHIVDLPDRLELTVFEEHDDWCYLSCHYGLGNTTISLTDVLSARERQLDLFPGRQWLRLSDGPLAWLHDLAAQRLHPDGSGRLRLNYGEVLALTSLVADVRTSSRAEQGAGRLRELLAAQDWDLSPPPGEPPAHLRAYQRHGLAWLHHLCRFGIGGLLADDMGLGKTHQALALVDAIRHQESGPMLVVCPASVLFSWAEKIDRFYPQLSYGIYYGGQRTLEELDSRNLLLTTYGIVRQDWQLLQTLHFAVIILDEIHAVKNPATAAHRGVAALNCRVRIGLTGTPVENSLRDLHALFDLCLPGLLGSGKVFEAAYGRPISERNDPIARERLSTLIHPFILRRSRAQVLPELPELIEDNRFCELSDDQIGLYRDVIDSRRDDLAMLDEDGGSGDMMHILSAITHLKRICCHPCLVSSDGQEGGLRSGKWDLFVELCEELLGAGLKLVVFSQYLGMIEMMEGHFRDRDLHCVTIKGEMAPKKRQEAIETFNSQPSCRVCCASLLAGGTGIDLTAAQAVIHYDRWWNAAKEEQATARVHRLGQKQVVQVFRLITRGTLEEKIHNLIIKKRDLAASLITDDDAEVLKSLDRRQLLELFRWRPASALKEEEAGSLPEPLGRIGPRHAPSQPPTTT